MACFACAQSLFVGTYNIRNHNSGDDAAGNVWTTRCKVICDQMNFEDPDIFGTQEVLHEQLADLTAGLDGYAYIGVGRDDGKTAGEYSAIFYKKDRIKLLRNGNFWLNETPDTPNSDGTPPAYASAHGASSSRRTPSSASIISTSTWIMWVSLPVVRARSSW